MKKEKLKGYLLIVGIASIILFPIVYIISSKIQSEELNKIGIKSTAIVQKVERTRNVRTRTFSYFITLSYQDDNKKEYSETLSIDFSEYQKRSKGQEIEILYDKENPKNIEILDYRKFKNTEERILHYDDLIIFQKNKNPEFILDKLNQISYGWEIKGNDSTFFINKSRKSYLINKKDTIRFFTTVANYTDVENQTKRKGLSEYEKIEVGYANNPFSNFTVIKKDFSMKVYSKKKQEGEFTLRRYEQFDSKRKMWNVMSCTR
ncbi:hypothetical protein N7U66_10055 [Lacinutrix neustonica]|uniref:DUF3592 domain-containing protein n=1 Tax=Lacinutrix neustonica TaxID=2980107 RepID=A0A9E8MXY6_9FLAO|nr:hypothetical protein [Lacinutrix neustonica]WAC03733.1 hypothetical protein N7U66_10055 [Lacinutrix neustonica]